MSPDFALETSLRPPSSNTILLDQYWVQERLRIRPLFSCCADWNLSIIFLRKFAQKSLDMPDKKEAWGQKVDAEEDEDIDENVNLFSIVLISQLTV
jgi:hypothetical protein